MWAEFEWENKVAINTSITDVNAFLEHIVSTTNMRCLTPISSHDGKLRSMRKLGRMRGRGAAIDCTCRVLRIQCIVRPCLFGRVFK